MKKRIVLAVVGVATVAIVSTLARRRAVSGAATLRPGTDVIDGSRRHEVASTGRVPEVRVPVTSLPMFQEAIAERREVAASDKPASISKAILENLGEILKNDSAFGKGSPEMAVRNTEGFIGGVALALNATQDSQLIAAMSQTVMEKLCAPTTTESELMMLSLLQQQAPKLINPAGLACALERRGPKEDVVTWSLLETWKDSDQPLPTFLADTFRNSADRRTRRLLEKIDN